MKNYPTTYENIALQVHRNKVLRKSRSFKEKNAVLNPRPVIQK